MKRAMPFISTSSSPADKLCEDFDSDCCSSIGSEDDANAEYDVFPDTSMMDESIGVESKCSNVCDGYDGGVAVGAIGNNSGISAEILRKLEPTFLPGGPEYSERLHFMLVDVVFKGSNFTTYYDRRKTGGRQQAADETHVLLFGREEHGGSVCVIVEGWYPYLLVKAPKKWRGSGDCCYALKELLEAKLIRYFSLTSSSTATRPIGGGRSDFIHSITTILAKSIYGYSSEGLVPFLKIEMRKPYFVNALHDVFVGYPIINKAVFDAEPGGVEGRESRIYGVVLGINEHSGFPILYSGQTETYNSNLDPIQQFMVGKGPELGLKGGQWVEIPFSIDSDCFLFGEDDKAKISTCTYEKHVRVNELKFIDIGEKDSIPPLRIMSFDIEAAGRRGVFPQATIDPVIQIALQFYVVGEMPSGEKKYNPILLSLKSCDAIEGVDVICFEEERALLKAFQVILSAYDPDALTGYNINNFDLLYLFNRANALGCYEESNSFYHQGSDEISSNIDNSFGKMTRLKSAQLVLRETEFVSAQMGKRKRVKVSMPGRVSLDMLTFFQNNHRLEGYSLNAVAEHFLGDKKVDLPFTQITPMWMKDAAARRELGIYCLKDAQLPIDLMIISNALLMIIEMARCTGVPIDWVLQRGSMVRTTYLLLEGALQDGYVFPNITPFAKQVYLGKSGVGGGGALKKKSDGDKYQGATVLEPTELGKIGVVAVLDFAALYPSIIMACNLCYCTYVADPKHPFNKKIGGDASDDERGLLRVNGHVFVSEKHCRGLIPRVVEYLLNCRKKAKLALAAAVTPLDKSLCKARELTYKTVANSMYGVLGSKLSFLPLKAMAETITGVGRQNLQFAKKIAEEMYHRCSVVYGDTDSIFVDMHLTEEIAKTKNVEEAVAVAMCMSEAIAKCINDTIKKPQKIEPEKVYSVLLLLGKKCYAGMMYSNGHKFGIDEPKVDIKGLSCARRDGCPLLRNMVKDTIYSFLRNGSEEDAAALVRARLLDLLNDRIPLEEYAIRKTIRKTKQDCCLPMSQVELALIRAEIKSKATTCTKTAGLLGGADAVDHAATCVSTSHHDGEAAGKLLHQAQLSYAEQDDAISHGIALPWKARVRLPPVELAWRLRLKDVGSAPVPGESIQYIVTHNGGKKVFEKVESLESVRKNFVSVDYDYYLNALREPVNKIFLPIAKQKLQSKKNEHYGGEKVNEQGKKVKDKTEELQIGKMVDDMIWHVVRNRHVRRDPEKKRACIAASPIFKAFERQIQKKKAQEEEEETHAEGGNSGRST